MPLHLLGVARRQDVESPPHGPVQTPRNVGQVANLPETGKIANLPQTGQIGNLPHTATNAHWLLHGDLAAAVVSPVPPSFRPLAHAALLVAIHQSVDILPARFGEILPDEESVRGLLAGRRQALLDDLCRLRGTGEMGLRIELLPGCVPPKPVCAAHESPAATSPTQYLALRRRNYQRQDCLQQRAQGVIEDYLHAMKGLYRDWRRLTAGRSDLVRLAFLVARGGWAGFEQCLADARAERTAERCTLVGPWPPYSFLGAGTHLDVV